MNFIQKTVVRMLEQIATDINPDILIWSGDNISHDVWKQNKFNQTKPTQILSTLIEHYFKNKNISVYPTIGNHECYPSDECDLNEIDKMFLFNNLS